MTDRIISQGQMESFIAEMTAQRTRLARQVRTWATTEARTRAELEQLPRKTIKALGASRRTGLCHLLPPVYPPAHVACPCGGAARSQRMRAAQVTTLRGVIAIQRPYYRCRHCRQGYAPRDHQVQLGAGRISAGRAEILAFTQRVPGAHHGSCAEAVAVLDNRTLVQVGPTTARAATADRGALIAHAAQQVVATACDPPSSLSPPTPCTSPSRLSSSLDGTMVHRQEGWQELKLGASSTTRTVHPRPRPTCLEVRAAARACVADLAVIRRRLGRRCGWRHTGGVCPKPRKGWPSGMERTGSGSW